MRAVFIMNLFLRGSTYIGIMDVIWMWPEKQGSLPHQDEKSIVTKQVRYIHQISIV